MATSIQEIQITWVLNEWIVQRDERMKKTYAIVNPRLRKLWDQGFYVEMVLVHSQVTEHMLKLILHGYEVKRNILKTLDEKDPTAEVKLEYDDLTLGELLKLLRKLTGKTSIIERLSRFNNRLRKEVVHHIFDGSKALEPFEAEIKEYFDGGNGQELRVTVDELNDALEKINNEIQDLVDASKKK